MLGCIIKKIALRKGLGRFCIRQRGISVGLAIFELGKHSLEA
jgi:hypothetical protein